MSKKIFLTLLIFCFAAIACAEEPNTISQAQALLEQGDYSQSTILLYKVINESRTPLQQAQAYKLLAEFYDKTVGDYNKAIQHYDKILDIYPEDGEALIAEARNELSRINLLKKQNAQKNNLLEKLRIESGSLKDQQTLPNEIKLLKLMIKDDPNYYRIAEAYYYLGQDYLLNRNYYSACKSFSKSLAVKPGIDFYLPVQTKWGFAHKNLVRTLAFKSSWSAAGILLLITVFAFYVSRPWKWITIRHWAAGVAVIILWCAFYGLLCLLLGKNINLSPEAIRNIGIQYPSFMSSSLGSLGSRLMIYLFAYGLIGVIGMFIFATAVSRLKSKWIRLIINFVFSLVLFSSLMTIFYLRYCDNKTLFYSPCPGEKLYYPRGYLLSIQSDPKPEVLTNPKDYPDLAVSNVDEPILQQWIIKYCPKTPAEQKH
jgi:tetratricopeptide (TPR) repeat protein